MAAEAGFTRVFFAGHAGKLIKAAGGMGNTHSRYGDHRMEITLQLAAELYGEEETDYIREEILSCTAMDEAVRILKENKMDRKVFSLAAEKLQAQIKGWSKGRIEARVLIFSKVYGVLGEA